MGTASTMASLCEGLGIALPQNGAIPDVDARRNALAFEAGRQSVAMVGSNLRMSDILSRSAFLNAVRLCPALGGSTNAVVHLLALAGRLKVDSSLSDWDETGRDVPCLVNLMPSRKYLMEDFFFAGGVPAVPSELTTLLDLDAKTVNGQSPRALLQGVEVYDRNVIFPLDAPFKPDGGIAALRGNLAPQGAVIKPSAATPGLMKHKGCALVFEGPDDLKCRINDPILLWMRAASSCCAIAGRKGFRVWPRSGICLSRSGGGRASGAGALG
jgi:L-arabonate dehydrase